MKTIFMDCNDQLAPVWESVLKPDDPKIDVNRKAFAKDDLPSVIRGYDIAIDDHSYMPTPLVELDELLAQSDVVSMNLTLGDETRGFLSAERIARMKKGAIYVNTARGALADETALVAALQSGHIRHAGLDVFHNEPLPPDHALAKLENVTLSAHAAFRTPEASETLLRRAIDIVKAIS
jgi:D-3-phosphoglycerate dehydrogenase